jgi:hypothetical protein
MVARCRFFHLSFWGSLDIVSKLILPENSGGLLGDDTSSPGLNFSQQLLHRATTSIAAEFSQMLWGFWIEGIAPVDCLYPYHLWVGSS